MNAYITNIEKETLDNTHYRKVLFTGDHLQLVVMNLKKGEDIPEEVHPDIDQFIRVEQGDMVAVVDGKEHTLGDDEIVIIPAGAKHRIINSGDGDLKIYSIYTPAEHPAGTVHVTREEAIEAEKHHHH